MKLLTILLFSILPFSSVNASPSGIIWYQFDAPPYFIKHGKLKNKGISQKFQRELIQQLPLQTHKKRYANFARAISEIANSNNACSVSLLKTQEYESFMHFSKPWLSVLANGLLIRANDLEQFSPFITESGVDIDALLTRTEFMIGVLNERPYGHFIDSTLNKHSNRRLYRLTGSSRMEKLLGLMTQKKKVDAVIGYAAESQFFANNAKNPAPIIYLPIANTIKIYEGYVGCSKTQAGKKIIEKIDALIDKKLKAQYISYYKSFLNKDTQSTFEQYYRE